MDWYEHQPIRWVLENLTAKQITALIVGIILIGIFTGSYYVYLDALQSIRNNPEYLWMFKMLIITFVLFFIAILPLTWKASFFAG